MSESKRYNLTAAREYESGGETKTAWVRLGTLWVRDDGSISGVLETAPVGAWFDGRIHAFRADEDSKRGGGAPRARQERPRQPEPAASDLDDDIPFSNYMLRSGYAIC